MKKTSWLLLPVLPLLLLFAFPHEPSDQNGYLGDAIQHLSETSEKEPLSFSPVLSWDKDVEAVVYEIEFFGDYPQNLNPLQPSPAAIFRSREIYTNQYNPPLERFAANQLGKAPLYWRIRSLDINGQPIAPFSELAILYTSASMPRMDAPIALQPKGAAPLLYPVYDWVRPYDAARFELQLFQTNPEKHPDAEPIDTIFSDTAEIYDQTPRYGNHAFFWRVRALDAAGNQLGNWSRPARFKTSPKDNWEVAVFGDSISHGGGHISFSPSDPEFSWLSYLEFPAINLSFSGDTTENMLQRFDQDVLPFHPQYLLIFNGSNSLRGGVPAESVITDFVELKERCLANGIKPIFLTLPPINPINIQRAFDEPTVDDWQVQFLLVNNYLRTQVHIDTAAAFQQNTLLPTKYALDGLHEDVQGKKLIAAAVNAGWAKAKAAADARY